MKKISIYILLGFAAFLLGGCLSVMDKVGQIADGSSFAEKKTARYSGADTEITVVQNKAGEQSIIIELADFPMMKLRGSMPDENGGFYLVSLEYLGGNVQGWNEFTLDLIGTGNMTMGSVVTFSIIDKIESVQISSGRIRSYGTLITGSNALTNLRNRRERIMAFVEFIKSLDSPLIRDIDYFEKYYKPLLFPEMVPARQRPDDWLLEGDVRIAAGDIPWNTGYTERFYPEELWNVRNSGTLFGDWEDALSWVYLEYMRENILELLSRQITLQQIK